MIGDRSGNRRVRANHQSWDRQSITIHRSRSEITMTHRLCCALVITVAFSTWVQAQTGTGELRGVLSSVRGPLAGLEVRIKNTATGEVATTTTSPSGEYSLRVAAGQYEVFAS